MNRLPLLALFLATFSAFSSQIPPKVENVIKVYQYDSYSLENGLLTVTYRRNGITTDMAFLLFLGICETQFDDNPWPVEEIKKIQLKNLTSDQVITMNGGGNECLKIGQLNYDDSKKYLLSLMSDK